MEDCGLAETASQTSTCPGYRNIMLLPVNFDAKPKTCKCCGERSISQPPLEDAAEDDTYGGNRPWLRYVRGQGTDDSFKQPAGSACLLCWQTFKGSGMQLQHGTLEKYLRTLRAKPEDRSKCHLVAGQRPDKKDLIIFRKCWEHFPEMF